LIYFPNRLNKDGALMADKKDEKKNGDWSSFNKNFGLLFNIGYYMSASLLVGLFIGYQADKFLGSEPLFTLVFIFLGMLAGFRELFKVTKINK